MSGHSKWSTIKRKKAATDARRSKAWTKVIREITIAARGGGDPEANPRLRAALTSAKSANMPNDTIEKAVKRGSGDQDGVTIEEINYEGYGPGGVAILVECQTDNKNRTAAAVRHVFTKFGGKLGAAGCVSYLFERKGMVVVDAERCDLDSAMDAAIDAGADDVADEGDSFVVYTTMENLHAVDAALRELGLPVTSAELIQEPSTTVRVEPQDAAGLLRLIMNLDEIDDVSTVSANFDIDDEVMTELNDEL
jgi:YebC/PmpR family DNA-binding regulatory protein